MVDVNLKEDDIDALLVEYEQCFDNYIYRDELVPHEFYYAIIIIGGITGVLETLGEKFGGLGITILFFIGLIALHVLHIDLMNNSSCKRAAINRALEIEDDLSKFNNSKAVLQLAHKIGDRKKYILEKWLKKGASSSYLMIWFVRFLTVIWIVYWIWLTKPNAIMVLYIIICWLISNIIPIAFLLGLFVFIYLIIKF